MERAEISPHTQEEGRGRRDGGSGRWERMRWRDVEVLLLVPHVAQISTGGLVFPPKCASFGDVISRAEQKLIVKLRSKQAQH